MIEAKKESKEQDREKSEDKFVSIHIHLKSLTQICCNQKKKKKKLFQLVIIHVILDVCVNDARNFGEYK